MKKLLSRLLMLLGAFLVLGAGNAQAWNWSVVVNGTAQNQDIRSDGDYTFRYDKLTTSDSFIFARQYGYGNEEWWFGKDNYSNLSAESKDSGTFYFNNGNKQGDRTSWAPSRTLYDVEIILTLKDGAYNVPSVKVKAKTIDPNAPVYPATVYLIGMYDGIDNWSPKNGLAASGNNGVYTWKGVKLLANDTFSFATKLSSSDSDWNTMNSSTRYGCKSGGADYTEYITKDGTDDVVECVSDAGSASAWKLDYSGFYNVTLNLATKKVSLQLVEYTDIWQLGYGSQTVNMTQDPTNKFIYKATVDNPSGNIVVKRLMNDGTYDGTYYTYMAADEDNNTLSASKKVAQFAINWPYDPGVDCTLSGLSGSVTFYWNAYTNKLSVNDENAVIPEAMYLYGFVNNGYWARGNKADLLPVYNEPGKYTNKYVEIQGQWSAWDGDLNHEPFTDCGDECYVALFDNVVEIFEFQKKGNYAFKLGSLDYENNIEGDRSNYRVNDNKTKAGSAKIDGQVEIQRNNFLVAKGTYTVDVDLNEGTVTFTPVPEEQNKVRTYQWYYGDDEDELNAGAKIIPTKDETTGIYSYSLKESDDYHNIVQVAVSNNPTHDAARQAEFQVWYNPNPYAKHFAKRRANLTPGEGTLYDGYTYVGATNDDSHPLEKAYVTSEGDAGWTTNPRLYLQKTGSYLITATLTDDAKQLTNYTINDATLYASVTGNIIQVNAKVNPEDTAKDGETGGIDPEGDNSSITFEQGKDIKQAFDTSGTNTLCTLGLDKKLNYGTDFTVTIAPISGYNNSWALTTSTSKTDLDKDYEDAFSTLQWDNAGNMVTPKVYEQYKSIGGVVDGFFTKIGAITVGKPQEDEDNGTYNYTISAEIPCSGIYTMVINCINDNYAFNGLKETYYVVIYPNLYGKFGNVSGFSINGYAFDENYNIGFPTDFTFTQHSRAFIPGTYFSSSLEVKAPEYNTGGGNVMKANQKNVDNDVNNVYYAPVDMRAYNSETSEKLTATVAKNGTTATYTYSPNKTSKPNVSTGVETIGGEADGEAVYFNLQGVRVENPKNGIFVKVQNGKAEKVVL